MREARDRDEFIRRFERVRLYFGDLAPAFMKESGRMLNLIQTERAERADVMSLKDAPESDGNTCSQV